jgi:hypothetical protein
LFGVAWQQYHLSANSLRAEGFNENFYTSVLQIDNDLWKFCFERGWCLMDDGTYCICDRPEQAEL